MTELSRIELTKKQTVLAVFFILAIISLLVLRIYFTDLTLKTPGPDYIVANDSVVLVADNLQLYVLSPDGNLIVRHQLSKAGIKNDFADMQLLNNDTVLIADWESYRILKCEILNLECTPLTASLNEHLGRFFKFHYRASNNDIFLADTDRHRILHYDINSRTVKTISDKKQFLYPNNLQFEDDGLLHITNTNRHEVQAFDYKNEKLAKVKSFKVPESASTLKWPIYFYRLSQNRMYILQGNNLLRYPDLVSVGDNQSTKIPVPAEADITVLARSGNQLLMTDRHNFKVYALDIGSNVLNEFGNHVFRQEMRAKKLSVARNYELADYMLYLMIATILGLVVFIIILVATGKTKTDKHSVKSEPPDTILQPIAQLPPGEIFWLEKNPKLRYLVHGLILGIIILAGLVYLTLSTLHITEVAEPDELEKLIMAAALFAGILLMTVNIAFVNLSYRLGTDGKKIFFNRFGSIIEADPSSIYFTRQQMLVNNKTFTYRNNMQSNFHNENQFKTYIEPLLEKFARPTTLFRLFLLSIRRPNVYNIFNTIVFILITALFFIYFGEDIISKYR